MQTLQQTIRTAAESLRGHYARDVVRGIQRWSGADLKGKARRYGASYARQRALARMALHAAGGVIVALRGTGRLCTAVRIGCDDFGTALYDVAGLGVVTADRLR